MSKEDNEKFNRLMELCWFYDKSIQKQMFAHLHTMNERILELQRLLDAFRQSAPDGVIQIFIQSMSGGGMTFLIDKSDTGLHLMQLIEEKSAIPLCQQRLTFKGKLIEADRTIYEHGITSLSTIFVMLRMVGD